MLYQSTFVVSLQKTQKSISFIKSLKENSLHKNKSSENFLITRFYFFFLNKKKKILFLKTQKRAQRKAVIKGGCYDKQNS